MIQNKSYKLAALEMNLAFRHVLFGPHGFKKNQKFPHKHLDFFFLSKVENGKSGQPGFRHRCGNGVRLKGVYCHFLTSSLSCYLTPSFKLIPGPSRLIWDSGLTWSGNGERIWHFLASSAQMTYFRNRPEIPLASLKRLRNEGYCIWTLIIFRQCICLILMASKVPLSIRLDSDS